MMRDLVTGKKDISNSFKLSDGYKLDKIKSDELVCEFANLGVLNTGIWYKGQKIVKAPFSIEAALNDDMEHEGSTLVGPIMDVVPSASYPHPDNSSDGIINKGSLIKLDSNLGEYGSLHSGRACWDKKRTKIRKSSLKDYEKLSFSMTDTYLENVVGSLPGSMDIDLVAIVRENQLALNLIVEVTDVTKPINAGNHIYWRLQGESNNSINKIVMRSNAIKIQVLDDGKPIESFEDIKNDSGLDFRRSKMIGKTSFDHYFVFPSDQMGYVLLFDERSNIGMLAVTDMPGAQIYTPEDRETFCFESRLPTDYMNFKTCSDFGRNFYAKSECYTNNTTYTFFDRNEYLDILDIVVNGVKKDDLTFISRYFILP